MNIGSEFKSLTVQEMSNVNGGAVITIAGITFTGWKAATLIAGGVTTLAGAAALGVWNGYKDTEDQKKE